MTCMWGSLLLSDSAKAAILVVGEKNVVFPSTGEAMPNRFVSWIPENETNLKAFGQKVEAAVRKKWDDIANVALDGMVKPAGFNQQIAGHLNFLDHRIRCFRLLCCHFKSRKKSYGN